MLLNFILPKFILKVERWKWNSEYRVYVSNLGNFKNEHKQRLPIKINSSGYCLIKTECGYRLAHRVVMLTWRPIPDAEELTVDHLNHNKRDNSLDNLEWVTKEENWERASNDFIYTSEQEKELEEIKNENQQHPMIKGGKKIFASYEEAAQFVITDKNMGSEVSKENIIRRIKGAAQNEQTYCGRKWKVVL